MSSHHIYAVFHLVSATHMGILGYVTLFVSPYAFTKIGSAHVPCGCLSCVYAVALMYRYCMHMKPYTPTTLACMFTLMYNKTYYIRYAPAVALLPSLLSTSAHQCYSRCQSQRLCSLCLLVTTTISTTDTIVVILLLLLLNIDMLLMPTVLLTPSTAIQQLSGLNSSNQQHQQQLTWPVLDVASECAHHMLRRVLLEHLQTAEGAQSTMLHCAETAADVTLCAARVEQSSIPSVIMQAARDSWRRSCQLYDCLTPTTDAHYQAVFRSATCVIVGFPAAAVRLAASSLARFVFSAISALLQRNQNTGGPTTSSERKLLGQAPTLGICSQHHK
eukprot:14458-Heterococcus_DN1.PRE.3